MGNIEMEKATDGELSQKIAYCRSMLALILGAERNGEADSSIISAHKTLIKNELDAAEQELERRFLLS